MHEIKQPTPIIKRRFADVPRLIRTILHMTRRNGWRIVDAINEFNLVDSSPTQSDLCDVTGICQSEIGRFIKEINGSLIKIEDDLRVPLITKTRRGKFVLYDLDFDAFNVFIDAINQFVGKD